MKKSPDDLTPLRRKAVERFARLARQYCELIENLEQESAFLEKIHELLPKLYDAARALPEAPLDTGKPLRSAVTARGWEKLFNSLQQKIGAGDRYREVFDAYKSTEPVTGMLSDDLADIYGELKSGLRSFEKGSACGISEAVWHWRFGFREHWGEHLTGALRALYWLERQAN
ncbi:MAG TPA: DUF5063 domain-containing protein [Planctomycetota bacterium]|nr:DUF5063 domain-containing protein [Planctomycetota bacterium]